MIQNPLFYPVILSSLSSKEEAGHGAGAGMAGNGAPQHKKHFLFLWL